MTIFNFASRNSRTPQFATGSWLGLALAGLPHHKYSALLVTQVESSLVTGEGSVGIGTN